MRSPRDHAQMLLDKAANDLVAARATVATGEALDTVCFHAQQAVEKSLKALLALKDVEFPWHHDLGELLILVQSHYQNLVDARGRVAVSYSLCSADALRRPLDSGNRRDSASFKPGGGGSRTG